MFRAIGAAIVGYIAMAIIVFAGLGAIWAILGPNGAFEPASWDTSAKWNLSNPVVGIIAAVAGGYLCALISPGARSLGILIGIIVVLGAMSAVAAMMTPEPTEARPEIVGMFDAMGNARAPLWAILLNPIVGVAGSFFGSRLRGRPAAASST